MMRIMTVIIFGVSAVIVLTPALFTVKDQEVHAKRIERGDKYTDQHRPIRKAGTGYVRVLHRINDRLFREEASEERGAH